ncbi:MAG: DUF2953 domain-containing protein, partial [Eubacteriales bacterium]
KQIELVKAELVLEIGFNDAAYTGMVTGLVWAFLGNMNSKAIRTVDFKNNNFNVDVKPNFNRQIFSLYFKSIISLRISHIIFTIFKLFKIARRLKNGRSSN